jgi:hypothetical protein
VLSGRALLWLYISERGRNILGPGDSDKPVLAPTTCLIVNVKRDQRDEEAIRDHKENLFH